MMSLLPRLVHAPRAIPGEDGSAHEDHNANPPRALLELGDFCFRSSSLLCLVTKQRPQLFRASCFGVEVTLTRAQSTAHPIDLFGVLDALLDERVAHALLITRAGCLRQREIPASRQRH